MKSSGFSLIELLVVISIIGILSSVVLASLKTSKDNASITEEEEYARQFRVALRLMYEDKGYDFPFDPADANPNQAYCLASSGSCRYFMAPNPIIMPINQNVLDGFRPYINSFPKSLKLPMSNPRVFPQDMPLYQCLQIENGKCVRAAIHFTTRYSVKCDNACSAFPGPDGTSSYYCSATIGKDAGLFACNNGTPDAQ